MATSEQINAVVDRIIAAFSGDAQAFETFLGVGVLHYELSILQAKLRNEREQRDADTMAHEAVMQDLQAQINAKQSEIDALEG